MKFNEYFGASCSWTVLYYHFSTLYLNLYLPIYLYTDLFVSILQSDGSARTLRSIYMSQGMVKPKVKLQLLIAFTHGLLSDPASRGLNPARADMIYNVCRDCGTDSNVYNGG